MQWARAWVGRLSGSSKQSESADGDDAALAHDQRGNGGRTTLLQRGLPVGDIGLPIPGRRRRGYTSISDSNDAWETDPADGGCYQSGYLAPANYTTNSTVRAAPSYGSIDARRT